MDRFGERLKTGVKTLIQRMVITGQLFGRNGLANHAAAGAYGFLFSAAPILLLVSFFMFLAFRSSPQKIVEMVTNIPFLDIVFDEKWLTDDFLQKSSVPGISSVISLFSIFWAGRILSVSLYRGLNIIFPGTKKRNPVTSNLIILSIQVLALVFSLVMILGSQTALNLYELFHFDPKIPVLQFFDASLQYRIFRIIVFIIALYFAYRAIPENPPQRSSALKGAIVCILTFELAVTVLDIMLGQQRYNFIYGALGKLIMLLVNVYFFFLLFFLSAQLAFVIDSLEALLFLRLRKSRSKAEKKRAKQPPAMQSKAVHSLFYSVEGKLKKYCRFHQQGETIFSYGDGGNEIYYILEGEVAVFLPTMRNNDDSIAVLGSGSFIGEMSYLTSESRSATIKAKTDVSALVLPPRIFDEILKNDADLNRTIIENLSRRVRKGNEQLAALTTGK